MRDVRGQVRRIGNGRWRQRAGRCRRRRRSDGRRAGTGQRPRRPLGARPRLSAALPRAWSARSDRCAVRCCPRRIPSTRNEYKSLHARRLPNERLIGCRCVPDQRSRILDATLGLMADHGASGTSMRAVAAACDCNVATLYHYFPSKHDLLNAAIAHRRAGDLPGTPFPEGLAGTVEERLAALLDHLFVGMTADEHLWRALLAEAIHGDDDVLGPLLETAA